MAELFLVADVVDSYPEFGIAGLTIGVFVWLFRSLLKDRDRLAMDRGQSERRKDELQAVFLTMVQEMAARQAETLVAATNTLARMTEAQRAHERHALQRHEAIMETVDKVKVALLGVCRYEERRP